MSSHLGEGTHVTVMLPISDMTEEGTVECSDFDIGVNQRLNHPITVLVAEDDEWSRDILVSLLENAGCQVIEAEDGELAIECFKACRPDMVMTDIRMPNKTGRDLLKAVMALDTENTIPIIAVTASTMTHELEELKKDGFWQVIAKPYKVEEVYDALVSHLDVRFVPMLGAQEEHVIDTSVENKNDYRLISLMKIEVWGVIYHAAKSGDINKTTEKLSLLAEKLSTSEEQEIKQAIECFNLEKVEELIVRFYPDILLVNDE